MREINLLPPDRRKKLRDQWWLKGLLGIVQHIQWSLIAVTVVELIVVLILQLLFLFSAKDAEVQLEEKLVEYQQTEQGVAEQNALAAEINRVSEERIVWSEVLNDFLPLLPAGTVLNSIGGDSNNSRITVTGSAASRNVLVLLEERLNSEPWVRRVEAPLTNLLERENPTFVFTVGIAP